VDQQRTGQGQMTADTANTIGSLDGLSLSVIIPAYNEEGGIRQTIEEVRAVLETMPISTEIIVVDDGSMDDTRGEAERAGARIEANPVNAGYGAALKRGIRASSREFVAILDADRTYPAHFLPGMLALARDYDMVVGDRGAAMNNVPLMRRPAKKMLNWLASFLAKRKLNDINSGMRVFRRSALVPYLPLLPSGFSFTTTITLCMACSEHPIVYTPIEYRARVGRSKIRPVDFINFIVLMLRIITLFNPLRIFLPAGLGLFLIGTLKLLYDITQFNLSETAVFMYLAALMLWSLGLIADMISRMNLKP
jgi:glycosyltransferase involved in cell wall biosynthesis